MISVALKDLYDEWERIGMAFDGYEVRKMEYSYNGLFGCCDYGVLSDAQKKTITIEKMAEVLEIAKKWDVYLVINVSEREMLKPWQAEGEGEKIGLDDLSVCVIQGNVIKTWLDAGALVHNALTHNFLHYQEDKEILAIETVLEESKERIESFQKNAYDSRWLLAHSTSLRTHYLMADFVIPDQSEIEVYLDGLLQRAYILSLLWANYCIELVRKL